MFGDCLQIDFAYFTVPNTDCQWLWATRTSATGLRILFFSPTGSIWFSHEIPDKFSGEDALDAYIYIIYIYIIFTAQYCNNYSLANVTESSTNQFWFLFAQKRFLFACTKSHSKLTRPSKANQIANRSPRPPQRCWTILGLCPTLYPTPRRSTGVRWAHSIHGTIVYLPTWTVDFLMVN